MNICCLAKLTGSAADGLLAEAAAKLQKGMQMQSRGCCFFKDFTGTVAGGTGTGRTAAPGLQATFFWSLTALNR
jgi:hypothetical protein